MGRGRCPPSPPRAPKSGPTRGPGSPQRHAKPRSDPGLRCIWRYLCGFRLLFLQNMVFSVDAVFRPPLHLSCRIIGGPPVNKHDLIAAVAASTNLAKTDAARPMHAMLTVIAKSYTNQEKVLL